MTESAPIYRVSRRFLANLCQQAVYGAVGVVVSWSLFWVLSQQLLPAHAGTNRIRWLFWTDILDPRLLQNHERELIRCLVGPGLAALVLFGGLVDCLTWAFVRYEVRPDKFCLYWGWWSRSIDWDVVQSVRQRHHARTELCSMIVSAKGLPPVLVRGLERLPELIETVRARVSRDAEWTPAPYRVDLTSRSANLVIGFLLPIPIHATWLAGYVGELSVSTISLAWAWLLMALAVGVWYWRPLSRRQMTAVELELLIAALFLVLSGLLTLVSSLESPNRPSWMQFWW